MSEGRPPEDDPRRPVDPGPEDGESGPRLPEPEETDLGPPTPIEEIPVVDPSTIPDPLETGEWKTAPDPFDTGVHRANREEKKKGKGRGRRKSKRGDSGRESRSAAPASAGSRRGPSTAQIGRRRLIAALIGVVAIAALIVAIVLLARGCSDDSGSSGPSASVPEMVGQTIIGRIGERGPSKQLVQKVRRGKISGVLMGVGRPEEASAYASRLRKAAKAGGQPPVLILIDQEGGYVKRLPGPPDIGPGEIAGAGGEKAALSEGRKTGRFLQGLGINVNLAPVVDVKHPDTADTIASRTYGTDPETVGRYGAAFVEGLQGAGVAATPKHFPALGLSTENTDFAPVSVDASQKEIEADLEAFRAPIEAGAKLVMVSSAVFPSVTGGEQAVYSSRLIGKTLRDYLGFEGVVISDDLEAPAAGNSPGEAAFRAVRAGVDLALFARTDRGAARAYRALNKAVAKGRLDRKILERAYERIQALKRSLQG